MSTPDFQSILRHLEVRAQAFRGNPQAMIELAKTLQFDSHLELDEEEALEWYRRAAEAGDADAMVAVGIYGDGEEGIRWLVEAAQRDRADACGWLAARIQNAFLSYAWGNRAFTKGWERGEDLLRMHEDSLRLEQRIDARKLSLEELVTKTKEWATSGR